MPLRAKQTAPCCTRERCSLVYGLRPMPSDSGKCVCKQPICRFLTAHGSCLPTLYHNPGGWYGDFGSCVFVFLFCSAKSTCHILWQVNIAQNCSWKTCFPEAICVQFNIAAIAACSFGTLFMQNTETQEFWTAAVFTKKGGRLWTI